MRSSLALLAVAVALVVAGCGGDKSGDTTAAPAPASDTTAASPTPAKDAKPSCEPANRTLVDALNSSLTISGGGRVKRVNVVEVKNPPDAALAGYANGVYAVAAEFVGPGITDTFGVWAASRSMVRTGGGLIIGADSVTRALSELGAAASAGSPAAEYAGQIAASDAGKQARKCAEG